MPIGFTGIPSNLINIVAAKHTFDEGFLFRISENVMAVSRNVSR